MVNDEIFGSVISVATEAKAEEIENILCGEDNIDLLIKKAQRRMSDNAAAIRVKANMEKALRETKAELSNLNKTAKVAEPSRIYMYYKLKDILTTQCAVLSAMIDYAKTVGDTRGSSLCFDEKGNLREGLEEIFRFKEENGTTRSKVQETVIENEEFTCSWRDVRPIPSDDDFFENVWSKYRENKNIY